MPLLNIQTNVDLGSQEQCNDFLAEASVVVANILSKPESYVMVMAQCNPHMLFAGNNEPLAYLELKSLGLPEDKTADLSKALCDMMNKHFQIDNNRVYIEFKNG